jgi:hypothetical protein
MAPGLHRPTHRSTHPPIHYLLRGGRLASLGLIAFLVACGGGGGGDDNGGDPPPPPVTLPPAATYGVGVTAVGIAAHHDSVGQTLTLTLNAEHDLTLDDTANGNFRMFEDVELEDGASYEIVVSAHPFNQLCTVVDGEGTVDGDEVTDPEVRCQTTVLNDTGIDWCADDGTTGLDCPEADNPGQDGDVGRDAAARDGTLTKLGDGAAGFDYTKIDADGNELPAGATEWSCVLDNVTGRMWEVKVNDETSLHHKDWTYTWYNQDDTSNGGNAGTPNDGSCFDEVNCDTEKFVAEVNAAGLCGISSGWRMPTRNELLSIVHNGLSNPAIDKDYFPNTEFTMQFWSSVPRAGNAAEAWLISASNGQVGWSNKSTKGSVRLVHGGQ